LSNSTSIPVAGNATFNINLQVLFSEVKTENDRSIFVVSGWTSIFIVSQRQKAEGRRQKAEGRRQKAEGRRQKAEGRRQKENACTFDCVRLLVVILPKLRLNETLTRISCKYESPLDPRNF
jgi:hypothetical protein